MKRILFTVSNDISTDQRMYRICNTLQEQGYDVILIGRNRNKSKSLQKQSYMQHRLNMWFDAGKLFYLELQCRLFFYLLFKPFDAVCGVDLDTILPCYLVSRIRGKVCFYDAHELFTEVPELNNRSLVRRIWLALERWICTRKSIVKYTVSQSVADIFFDRYNAQFDVIRNMPHIKNTGSGNPSSNIIVYRGAVNKGRGLEFLIQAMQFNGYTLIIAGDGDITASLKELVIALKLTDRIQFTGYLSPAELDHIAVSARIGVNLLDSVSLNYYYSLANKFFDYVHLGLPQITMRFPEYEKLNATFEVAILLDSLQPGSIAVAIDQLMQHNEYYKQLQTNCKHASAVWNWEEEKNKLITIYRFV